MTEKMLTPFPQELLAVKEGIKPVMRTGLGSNYAIKNKLTEFCKEFNLHMVIKSFTSIHGEEFENIVYVSKSKELTKQAYEAEKGRDVKKLGELLGYPECCVNFYNNFYYLVKEKINKNETLVCKFEFE